MIARTVLGIVLVATVPVGVPFAPLLAHATSQQDLEESLTCQCGCGLTVHSCNHLQCPSGEPIKDEIRRRLGEGESKDVILAHFASKYGEKVLSAPTFSGFNWFAWLTPFAAVFIAGLGLAIVIRRRASESSGAASVPDDVARADATDEARDRLRDELEDFDR